MPKSRRQTVPEFRVLFGLDTLHRLSLSDYGALAGAFLSGIAFALVIVSLNGGTLDFRTSFAPWPWTSLWSIICLVAATIWGLYGAAYLAASRAREIEREFLRRRLEELDERATRSLEEARKRAGHTP